uniref:Uncharacterized protein n=1 Tax=Arundo donax TaxID=35708 RepID=A0A0A8YPG2_ARUDO
MYFLPSKLTFLLQRKEIANGHNCQWQTTTFAQYLQSPVLQMP